MNPCVQHALLPYFFAFSGGRIQHGFFEEFLMFPASGKGFVTGSVEGFPGRERCLPRVRRAENGLDAGFLRP